MRNIIISKNKYIIIILITITSIILMTKCANINNFSKNNRQNIGANYFKSKDCITVKQLKVLDYLHNRFISGFALKEKKYYFDKNTIINRNSFYIYLNFKNNFINPLNQNHINFEMFSNYFSILTKTKQISKNIFAVYFSDIQYFPHSMEKVNKPVKILDYYLFYNTKKKLWIRESYFHNGIEFKF